MVIPWENFSFRARLMEILLETGCFWVFKCWKGEGLLRASGTLKFLKLGLLLFDTMIVTIEDSYVYLTCHNLKPFNFLIYYVWIFKGILKNLIKSNILCDLSDSLIFRSKHHFSCIQHTLVALLLCARNCIRHWRYRDEKSQFLLALEALTQVLGTLCERLLGAMGQSAQLCLQRGWGRRQAKRWWCWEWGCAGGHDGIINNIWLTVCQMLFWVLCAY